MNTHDTFAGIMIRCRAVQGQRGRRPVVSCVSKAGILNRHLYSDFEPSVRLFLLPPKREGRNPRLRSVAQMAIFPPERLALGPLGPPGGGGRRGRGEQGDSGAKKIKNKKCSYSSAWRWSRAAPIVFGQTPRCQGSGQKNPHYSVGLDKANMSEIGIGG